MNRLLFSVLLIVLVTGCSCDKRIIGPDPKNNPMDNFNLLCEDFDSHDSRFLYKRVHWDSLRTVMSTKITDNITDDELFDILSSMLAHLRDAHAVLESPSGFYQYFSKGYVRNFNLSNVKSYYLQKVSSRTVFTYGPLTDGIGYIHIRSFASSKQDYQCIDALLEEMKESRGLVVDVRSNGGGSSGNAETVAGRFADERRLYGRIQYRNGPLRGDFTDLTDLAVSPDGPFRFTKKVVLLTNRFVGSAAEDFILMMRVMPHVTVVGDTTSGTCGGSPGKGYHFGQGHRNPAVKRITLSRTNIKDDLFLL